MAMSATEQMFDYARHAADRICENAKTEAQAAMLRELSERAVEIARAGAGNTATNGGVGSGAAAEARAARKLRSKVKAEEAERTEDAVADGGEGGAGAGAGAGADASFSGLLAPAPLTLALPRDEALSDLRFIYREWKAVARRWGSFAAAALVPARVERQRLLVGNESFAKGDAVAVFSELTRQEFPGVVFAVAPTEAIIRLSDGTRCRVQLQHLRNGRVAIYKYAPPAPGVSSGVIVRK